MIWRLGLLIRPHVATVALGGQALPVELPDRSHPVAGIAIRYCVRADQREAILMLVNVMNRDLPPVYPVTEVALRSVFAAMEIGVAVLAVAAYVGENAD